MCRHTWTSHKPRLNGDSHIHSDWSNLLSSPFHNDCSSAQKALQFLNLLNYYNGFRGISNNLYLSLCVRDLESPCHQPTMHHTSTLIIPSGQLHSNYDFNNLEIAQIPNCKENLCALHTNVLVLAPCLFVHNMSQWNLNPSILYFTAMCILRKPLGIYFYYSLSCCKGIKR